MPSLGAESNSNPGSRAAEGGVQTAPLGPGPRASEEGRRRPEPGTRSPLDIPTAQPWAGACGARGEGTLYPRWALPRAVLGQGMCRSLGTPGRGQEGLGLDGGRPGAGF